jgi:hypothetical protein
MNLAREKRESTVREGERDRELNCLKNLANPYVVCPSSIKLSDACAWSQWDYISCVPKRCLPLPLLTQLKHTVEDCPDESSKQSLNTMTKILFWVVRQRVPDLRWVNNNRQKLCL